MTLIRSLSCLLSLGLTIPVLTAQETTYTVNVAGKGVEIFQIPEGTEHAPGTLLLLEAQPIDPNHEFMHWYLPESYLNSGFYTPGVLSASPDFAWQVERQADIVPVVGRRMQLGEREVIGLWMDAFAFVEETVDGQSALVSRPTDNYGSASYNAHILVPDVGEGVLAVEAKALERDTSLNNYYVFGMDGWETQYIPVSFHTAYYIASPGTAVLSSKSGDYGLAVRSVSYLPGFRITTEVSGEGRISLSEDKVVYSPEVTVELTAIPAVGWHFHGWEGDINGTENPLSIRPGGHTNISAVFQETPPEPAEVLPEFSLSVPPVTEVPVMKDPELPSYPLGTRVTLSVDLPENVELLRWERTLSANLNPYVWISSEDTALNPQFRRTWEINGGTASTEGSSLWSRDAEGAFLPPAGGVESDSTLMVPLPGPCRTKIWIEAIDPASPVESFVVNYANWRMSEMEPGKVYTVEATRTDAAATIHLSASADYPGLVDPNVRLFFERYLPVEIDDGGGELTLTGVEDGYAKAEERVAISYTPPPGKTFLEWEGLPESTGQDGSFVVEAVITARPIFAPDFAPIQIGGMEWTPLTGSVLTYSADFIADGSWTDGAFTGTEPDGPYEYETAVSGPAVLSIDAMGEALSIFMDGEFVEYKNLNLSNPRTITVVIPKGIHTLRLLLNGYNSYDSDVTAALSNFVFEDSTSVVTFYAYLGTGSVSVDGTNTVPLGQTLAVEAVPGWGNRFLSWLGDAAGKPSTFNLTVEDHHKSEAVFEAADVVGGFEPVYNGLRPVIQQRQEGGSADVFINANLAEPGQPSSMVIPFEGSGRLTTRKFTTNEQDLSFTLLLDGEPLEQPEQLRGPLMIDVGPGTHAFEARWEMISPLQGFRRLFVFPEITEGFPVETTVDAVTGTANVVLEPLQEFYFHGDAIIVSADPLDNEGRQHVGWKVRDKLGADPQYIMGASSLQLTVEGSTSVEAIYRIPFTDPPDAMGFSFLADNAGKWTWEPPAGEDAQGILAAVVESGSRYDPDVAGLESRVSGPAFVEFKFRQANGRFDLSMDGQLILSEPNDRDWAPMIVQIPAGEHFLRWKFTGSFGGTEYLEISELEKTPGYAFTAVGDPGTEIIWSSSDPRLGKWATISARSTASGEADFHSWRAGNGERLSGQRIAAGWTGLLTASYHTVLTAEIPWQLIEGNWSGGWTTGGGLLESSFTQHLGGISRAYANVSGPAALFFHIRREASDPDAADGQSIKFYLDGEFITPVKISPGEYAIDFPQGSSQLEVLHSVSAVPDSAVTVETSLMNMRFAMGFRVTGHDYGIGKVLASPVPESGTVEPGTEVTFAAVPSANSTFNGWAGDLAGEPEGPVQRTVSSSIDAMAHFSGTVRFGLLDFHALNLEFTREVDGWIGWLRGAGPHTLQTTLEGPGVFRMGDSWRFVHNVPEVTLTREGTPSENPAVSTGEYLQVAIPEGVHELTLAFNETFAPYPVAFHPGYALWVEARDGSIHQSVSAAAHLPDSIVKLQPFPDPGYSSVIWSGIDATGLDTLSITMDQHYFIEADFGTELVFGDHHWLASGLDVLLREDGEGIHAELTAWVNQRTGILRMGIEGPLEASFLLDLLKRSNYSQSAELTLKVDGQTQVKKEIASPYATPLPEEWVTTLGEGMHELTWMLEPIASSPGATGYVTIGIYEPSFISGPIVPFREWRRNTMPRELWDDPAADTLGDPDNDGLSNYLEFLLSMDPLLPDIFLDLQPIQKDTHFYRLRHYPIPDAHFADFDFEVSIGSLLDWTNADPWITNPFLKASSDGLDQGFDLQLDPTVTGNLWVRIKYLGEIPLDVDR